MSALSKPFDVYSQSCCDGHLKLVVTCCKQPA